MIKPNIIFCNLQNSGSSAIDPILKEIFKKDGYYITPYGPEGTSYLLPDLHLGLIKTPFYHWTHDPIETFDSLIGSEEFKFIYLHRDPRDAAVSWAHDLMLDDKHKNEVFQKMLESVVTHNQPIHLRAAVKWVNSGCKIIRFDQIKEDIFKTISDILDYIKYYDEFNHNRLNNHELVEIINKHSFENITGRARGDEGEIYRNQYMLRKGISGEWKKYFSPELIKKCNELVGREIIELGYPINQSHANISKKVVPANFTKYKKTLRIAQIVSPPFACGVAWLINALLHLNIRVTSDSFKSHWYEYDGKWKISEEANNHLKWHLPVLHEREVFDFPEDLDVRWEHRLDFAAREACPTILFVRDPRDAVYSLYRRNYSKDISFSSFLTKPDEWPDHFPNLFHLPPIETYAYFCNFWLSMHDSMPLKVIRFEDAKLNPFDVLKDVLFHLGIERKDNEIVAAIQSSDFQQARKAMQIMELNTRTEFKTAVKGQVGEWRETFTTTDHKLINQLGKFVISQLGYADNLIHNGNYLYTDYRVVLTKMLSSSTLDLAINWLLCYEEGIPINATEIANEIINNSISGEDLLKIGVVLQSIFYVNNIFADGKSKCRLIALNTFINLNFKFFSEWPVMVSALKCLNRIESKSELKFLTLLGEYEKQLTDLSISWQLFTSK